jgi:putative transposase
MTSWRRRQGYAVNRKRVRRLMRRLGLPSVAPKPGTAQPAPGHPVYPYLLRGLAIVRPNQVWCTDITSIRLAHGFVYLTAVMDWYSRYVLSREVSVTLAEECCISAVQSAWRGHGRSEIFNSDQGAQFTSQALTAVLTAAEERISRDGKGRAMDNIRVERLWRTVKYEEIYLKEYRRVSDLIAALKAYFWFYNPERPHQSLAGATPVQVHRGAVQLAA